jgi:hypothetical protein
MVSCSPRRRLGTHLRSRMTSTSRLPSEVDEAGGHRSVVVLGWVSWTPHTTRYTGNDKETVGANHER